ncbi:MAG: choice-of-anchor B domain-containing protein [Sphingobacteriales bacterium]|jgi:choice-of-anchor B domain-containing protein
MKKFRIILSAILLMVGLGVNAQNHHLDSLSGFYYTQDINDVWGYVDSNGTEYALLGVENGTAIISLADLNNPEQKFYIPGQGTIWRDLKTWAGHAYVSADNNTDSLLIIDLTQIHNDSIRYKFESVGDLGITQAHNVWVDDKGFLYQLGADYLRGGAAIYDLNADPYNPALVGFYDEAYLHDAYVRGDTLYGSEINNGKFSIIDIQDKANPVVISKTTTPFEFAHNGWLSDDGKTYFSTDEKPGAFIASYDVSDPMNVTELDRIRIYPGNKIIPHNVHVLNDFIVTSYYEAGVVIYDGARPDNLIEVGHFDTYLQGNGDSYEGCWGAYPFLPSGVVLASSAPGGLYVLQPDYKRGCYFEGTVIDSLSRSPINGAKIEILETLINKNTSISGVFKTGLVDSGYYSVRVSKTGYFDKIIDSIFLDNGLLTAMEVELLPFATYSFTGVVTDKVSGDPVPFGKIQFKNGARIYDAEADAGGQYSMNGVTEGAYEAVVGAWGHLTEDFEVEVSESNNTKDFELLTGIYDDFIFDFGWEVKGDALRGVWERGIPMASFYRDFSGLDSAQAESDLKSDFGDNGYFTGRIEDTDNNNNNNNEVDQGKTVIYSPEFDGTKIDNPVLSYYRWFYINGGSVPGDTMITFVTNGSDSVRLATVAKVNGNNNANNTWKYIEIALTGKIDLTSTMKVGFEISDYANKRNFVEAGIDKVTVMPQGVVNSQASVFDNIEMNIYPNPVSGNQVIISIPDFESVTSLEVISIDGKVRYSQIHGVNNMNTINLSEYPSGIYFVKIKTDKGVQTQKFIN